MVRSQPPTALRVVLVCCTTFESPSTPCVPARCAAHDAASQRCGVGASMRGGVVWAQPQPLPAGPVLPCVTSLRFLVVIAVGVKVRQDVALHQLPDEGDDSGRSHPHWHADGVRQAHEPCAWRLRGVAPCEVEKGGRCCGRCVHGGGRRAHVAPLHGERGLARTRAALSASLPDASWRGS
jgi:hypothetical protein